MDVVPGVVVLSLSVYHHGWVGKCLEIKIDDDDEGKNSMAFRLWRNKVQRGIKAAKYNYYHNKVAQVEQINPAK